MRSRLAGRGHDRDPAMGQSALSRTDPHRRPYRHDSGRKTPTGGGIGRIALDMESAAIASAASACLVPFLAIRGVLDPVQENLAIGFDQFLDDRGEPQLPALIRYLITHPLILPHMVRLGLRTRAVCARLGLLLQELSTTLS